MARDQGDPGVEAMRIEIDKGFLTLFERFGLVPLEIEEMNEAETTGDEGRNKIEQLLQKIELCKGKLLPIPAHLQAAEYSYRIGNLLEARLILRAAAEIAEQDGEDELDDELENLRRKIKSISVD